MLRRLLLSLGVLQVALAFLASGHGRLDERGPILEDTGRPSSPGLEMVKEVHIPDFKQVTLGTPRVQDDLEPEASMMMSAALQAQEREGRSPRRCVRVQESCLGHKLPCCDPCATCYCRFFNANCFCKKFSTFPCGRN
ncbi:agouti-related protein [Protobothrops mucrosquamatus]|uniref:agouti-related protein n=1 Tax=Protobothrops mucrosquamatus TaxID=103944 RepID=UPI000775DD4B|nr:agouti-related protein [Protobothrops mucrosquamatus]